MSSSLIPEGPSVPGKAEELVAEQAAKYARDKHVPELIRYYMEQVITERPEDILAFLQDKIENDPFVPPPKPDPTEMLTNFLKSLSQVDGSWPADDALSKVADMLHEGADPSHTIVEEGVWGAGSSFPILAYMLERKLYEGNASKGAADIVVKMIESGADLSRQKGSRDWRGSGSYKTLFSLGMSLRAHVQSDATLRILKVMLEHSSSKAFKGVTRSVSSMRSDGSLSSNILHDMISRLNTPSSLEDFKLVVKRMGELDLLGARASEMISNERGDHRLFLRDSLHILLNRLSGVAAPRNKGEEEGEVVRRAKLCLEYKLERRAEILRAWQEQKKANVCAKAMRERLMVAYKKGLAAGDLQSWRARERQERRERIERKAREEEERRDRKAREREERRERILRKRREKEERKRRREETKGSGSGGESEEEWSSEEEEWSSADDERWIEDEADLDSDNEDEEIWAHSGPLSLSSFFRALSVKLAEEEEHQHFSEGFDLSPYMLMSGVTCGDLRRIAEELGQGAKDDYGGGGDDDGDWITRPIDDGELELGEEPSIEWRLDTGLTVEEPKLEEFEAKARTEVAISKVEYGILVKALSYLLDSGVDVNTLSAGLLTTKNSERNEKWAEDDDPRVDGYEPSEFKHIILEGPLSKLFRGKEKVMTELDFSGKPSMARTEVTALDKVEVVYVLALKGLDFTVGSAHEVERYHGGFRRVDLDTSTPKDACRGKGEPGKWKHTAFKLEGGELVERAMRGEWRREMAFGMGSKGMQRVQLVMMALRRKGVTGDVGEVIISFMIAMEVWEGSRGIAEYFA